MWLWSWFVLLPFDGSGMDGGGLLTIRRIPGLANRGSAATFRRCEMDLPVLGPGTRLPAGTAQGLSNAVRMRRVSNQPNSSRWACGSGSGAARLTAILTVGRFRSPWSAGRGCRCKDRLETAEGAGCGRSGCITRTCMSRTMRG